MRAFLTGAAICILSTAVGVAGLYLTAKVFDANNWGYFHSWALLHGTGALCFLMWSLVGVVLSRLGAKRIGMLSPSETFSLLPYLAFIAAALGTFLRTEYFMWVGAVLGAIALVRWCKNRSLAAPGVTFSALFVSTLSIAYWGYIEFMLH